jgi:hypothetical protein
MVQSTPADVELIYFALKKAMGDCRRAEREDGLDLLG